MFMSSANDVGLVIAANLDFSSCPVSVLFFEMFGYLLAFMIGMAVSMQIKMRTVIRETFSSRSPPKYSSLCSAEHPNMSDAVGLRLVTFEYLLVVQKQEDHVVVCKTKW